jgi:dihydroxyacetone synthase
MGALQELQLIHVGSHDSIGIGKDGPTHQPIELAALFRAMPNLLYIRPADNEETAGAWSAAIDSKTTPTIISTSRVVVPQLRPFTSRHGVTRGAYVLKDMDQADVTIIGVGAELHMAVEVASGLCDRGHNSRVVSFPCQRLFEKQSADYKQRVLQRRGARVSPVVVIEPYVSNGWDRYADAGICMGTHRFGKSLPTREVYEYFGFEVQAMVEKIAAYLDRLGKKQERLGQFVELNESDQS